MTQTNYGQRKQGSSRFIIVAPHAAGDDLRTKEVAEEIARHLNASLVINEKYVKPSNSRAASTPKLVEDFNKLSWSASQQDYIWDRKHPHMKEFYDHIKEFVKIAKQHGNSDAVVVYIHGMGDNSDKIGIDIGCGLRYHDGRLKGTQGTRDRHPDAGSNTGVRRAKREDIESLKGNLEQRLNADGHNLKVGVGEKYAAWSRQDGVQYHANDSDATSFQLEISSELRKPEKIKYLAKLISDALKNVYEKNR
jgi:hypothetical protein